MSVGEGDGGEGASVLVNGWQWEPINRMTMRKIRELNLHQKMEKHLIGFAGKASLCCNARVPMAKEYVQLRPMKHKR
jgi:hypothetical protein